MNTATNIKTYSHHVRIPASLKAHKTGVGAGIMYLALGEAELIQTRKANDTRPSDNENLVTVKFTLSELAENYLTELLKTHQNKREIFVSALAWVSRQPAHIQKSKL